MNYLYDGSFAGFLTCVWHHYKDSAATGIFDAGGAYQLDMTRYGMTLETDARKAETVFTAIEGKISKWDAERIYRAHHSDEPEKEMKLLRYIQLGFKEGGRIRLLHGHPVVADAEHAERRLANEAHRLTGVIRFSEIRAPDGSLALYAAPPRQSLLYSKITPDCDVLEFLAPHFTDRFKYDPFVIHDERREKALFSYSAKWCIKPLAKGAYVALTEDEAEYRRLWRRYFDAMATRERENPKLQRKFVPLRYQKNMTEFGG